MYKLSRASKEHEEYKVASMNYSIRLASFYSLHFWSSCGSIYGRTLMARVALEQWKHVRDRGSSS